MNSLPLLNTRMLPGAGQSGRYPMRLMLPEEALVVDVALSVCARVAPSVQQIAAHAAVAAGAAARLLGGWAVVYNP